MTTPPEVKPRVLIYRSELLHLSETFISEQALHLKQWKPVLVGKTIVPDGLTLSNFDILLFTNEKSILKQFTRKIQFLLGLPSKQNIERLRIKNAQLVHAHFGPEAINIWPLAKFLKLPLIVTLHGYDINIDKKWWESGKGGICMKNYPTRLLNLAKEKHVHFLAVSEAIRDRAIEYGIQREKIAVLYIGIDTNKFSPGFKPIKDRKQILFVGRLVEKKGCHYLLQAFLGIQDQFPEYELVIVGTGPLEMKLKMFSENNNIRAIFLGGLNNDQVRARMNEARLFCLPSITTRNGDAEGLPIVILEAQASGVPVITSARGGADEGIIDGKTGIAHKEKDVFAIKQALKKLLTDDAMAELFSIEARINVVKNMNIEECTSKLEEKYSLVYAEHKNG